MFYDLTDKIGSRSIAEIVDKRNKANKYDKKKYLYIKKIPTLHGGRMLEWKIKDPNIVLKPLMMRQTDDKFPNRVYIAGTSGCGKSHIAAELAKDYNFQFKQNPVALFSYKDEDKALNEKKIKNFCKLKVDDTMLDTPITLDELHDKCVIFDDCHHFEDKEFIREMERLQKATLNAGRTYNIDVIICRQKLLDSHATADILNSVFQVIAFPQTASKYGLAEWLKRYLHLPKQMIDKICNVHSRYVLINNTVPPYCLHEKGAFMLYDPKSISREEESDEDDDEDEHIDY